jgi:hypothetical protein
MTWLDRLESKRRGACQHRANWELRFVLCLTLDIGFGTGRAHGRGTGRAGLRLRALHHGTPGSWARRALADLTRLGAGRDTGGTVRDRGFEDVLGHVGLRRALRLQHILGHVGHRGARGHRRLEHPLTGVGFLTFGTRNGRRALGAGFRAGFGTATRPLFTADVAHASFLFKHVESFYL